MQAPEPGFKQFARLHPALHDLGVHLRNGLAPLVAVATEMPLDQEGVSDHRLHVLAGELDLNLLAVLDKARKDAAAFQARDHGLNRDLTLETEAARAQSSTGE